MVNGTRSGSGRIVYEHYDKLVSIRGGSADTKPLPYGIRSDDFEDGNTNKKVYDSDDNYDDHDYDGENNSVLNRNEITATDSANNNNTNQNKSDCTEDKNYENNVPPRKNCDIHNKRRHLEKNLSSAHCDKLLLDESKEDAQFRRDLAAAVRESTVSFTASMENIGRSMTQLSNSLCQSIEMLSQVMCNNDNISSGSMMPPNQNLMYQNTPQQQQLVYCQDPYTNWLSENEKTNAFDDQDSVTKSGNSRYHQL